MQAGLQLLFLALALGLFEVDGHLERVRLRLVLLQVLLGHVALDRRGRQSLLLQAAP